MTRERDPVPPGEPLDATVARRVGRQREASSERVPAGRSEPGEGSSSHGGERIGSEPEPRSAGSAAMTGAALAEVMFGEEVTRAHGFATFIVWIAAGVLVVLPLLGGDPTAKGLCGAALAVMAAVSIRVWYLTRPQAVPLRRATRLLRAQGWVLVLGVTFVEYYFGFFSPVPVVLSLGTYYLGQSTDRIVAVLLPVLLNAVYAALALLTATSVLEDRGLFSAEAASLTSHLFAVATITAVLGLTQRLAGVSRRALREAIERSNEALLVAQRREAQLAEAHHQLDRALRIAVGKPGRYTTAMAGEHRLGVVIGIGAIGEVYEAEHVTTGEKVAVKLLQASALQRDDLVERILREGALSRQLDNPHVVRVFGVGRMTDGAPYLTMELLRGRDLASRLRQEGQLDLAALAHLCEEVAIGLEHAHEAGIVHRDLKPLNIYEAQQSDGARWKILDFGISKLTSSGGTLTQEGVVGTPGYMSPEQAKGVSVDRRSDVFSMAVVIYRALTGQPAFPGDSTPQIMFDIVYKMPKRPSTVARGVPSELDLVLAIGLAKDPDDRFQSAAELAEAFSRACRRELSSELRARGHRVLRACTWGATMTARPEPDA